MSLQAEARKALAAVRSAAADAVVTVAYNGATAQGLLDTTPAAASPDLFGEEGVDTGTVRLEADDLSTPPRGATIKVAGEDKVVTDTRIDSLGANLTIDYQDVREVSGI